MTTFSHVDEDVLFPDSDRKPGRLKVTGGAQYSADVPIANLAYGVIFHSAITLGRVVNIDTRAAEGIPRVIGVITHMNAPELILVNRCSLRSATEHLHRNESSWGQRMKGYSLPFPIKAQCRLQGASTAGGFLRSLKIANIIATCHFLCDLKNQNYLLKTFFQLFLLIIHP